MTLCSKKGVVKHPKDFLIDVTLEDNEKKADKKVDTKPTNTKLSCEWKLFTDGATSSDRSAGRSPIEAVNRRERDLTASPQTDDIVKEIHEDTSRLREMQEAIRDKESIRKQRQVDQRKPVPKILLHPMVSLLWNPPTQSAHTLRGGLRDETKGKGLAKSQPTFSPRQGLLSKDRDRET
ncbi:hypothetical protein Tco_0807112 [Tanacetum coccineum]